MIVDIETVTMMRIASALDMQHIKHWPIIRRGIRERCAMFESGHVAAPRWFRKRLQEIDPLLDIRWDYLKEQWLIERYSRADRAFVAVLEVKDHLDQKILWRLHEADTWRFPSPEAYIAHKHEQAATRRAQIEKEGDEKVAAAIDSLSTKQTEEFMAVEKAMHTGETIVLHGQSEKIMERMADGSRRALAQGIEPPKAKMFKKPEGNPSCI